LCRASPETNFIEVMINGLPEPSVEGDASTCRTPIRVEVAVDLLGPEGSSLLDAQVEVSRRALPVEDGPLFPGEVYL
jgi:hypothetical protein